MKLALLTAALALVSSTAFAANADFVLVNKTGYDINEVYISPSNKQNWGDDRLGDYQFAKNESVTMKFGDTNNCQQDIKVVFSDDGTEIEWEDFNLCEINKITLKYNSNSGEVSAEFE